MRSLPLCKHNGEVPSPPYTCAAEVPPPVKTLYVHAVRCIIAFTSQGVQYYPPGTSQVIKTHNAHVAISPTLSTRSTDPYQSHD
jgi:hypothetical protein